MESSPLVTFIICTYNRAPYLDDTLQSLIRHRSDDSYEILVVDNNSSDETPMVVEKRQQEARDHDIKLRYIKETEQGLSHARNRGIREAEAPNVVFFDDDITAGETLIPTWCSFFEENSEAVAGGGKIHVQFDHPRPPWMPRFLLPLLGHHDLGNARIRYPAHKYPFGGNMGFRKSLFERIGDFNTDLGRKGDNLDAGEEKELFQRIRHTDGGIVFLPKALLYHRVGEERLTVGYIRKQAYGVGKSRKLKLSNASPPQKLLTIGKELSKTLVTLPLFFIYLLKLKPSKALMLVRFRWWVWRGYVM